MKTVQLTRSDTIARFASNLTAGGPSPGPLSAYEILESTFAANECVAEIVAARLPCLESGGLRRYRIPAGPTTGPFSI